MLYNFTWNVDPEDRSSHHIYEKFGPSVEEWRENITPLHTAQDQFAELIKNYILSQREQVHS